MSRTVAAVIGQHFTPEPVVRALFRLARAKRGQRIVDPSCGDGAFLRGAPPGCELHGCEIDPGLEVPVPGARVRHGDALRELADLWGTFDLAIGNPPFSAQAHLERRPEVLGGFDLASGRKSQCLEVLFLELFLRLVKPGGRIAIILPDGPLSNGPFDYVRQWLLQRTQVEAIVGLPRRVFSTTTAKTSLLVARKQPLAAQPSRAPTWLWTCDALDPLDWTELPPVGGAAGPGRRLVLAEISDWRAEAQAGAEADAGAPAGAAVRLGDVFRLRTGFAAYAKKRMLFADPGADRLLLLRAKNIRPDGGLRTEQDAAFLAVGGPVHRAEAELRPGEIVFVRVGAGCYGRTALVPDGLRAQADDWMHILTPTRPIDAAGLVAWMNGEEGRAVIRRMAKGVGTLSVSRSALAGLRIPERFLGHA